MPDDPPVFLTESRREVLNGTYDGNDSTRRSHETMIRARTAVAVEELIEVAKSPNINNWDAFNSKDIAMLVAYLTQGSGGLHEPDDPSLPIASPTDEDFAREVYVKVDSALHGQPEKDVPE